MIGKCVKVFRPIAVTACITLFICVAMHNSVNKSYRRSATAEVLNKDKLLIIQTEMLDIYESFKANERVFQGNSDYAYHGFELNMQGDSHLIDLYYKILSTQNASAEIGVFQYHVENKLYNLLYGRDYPTNHLVIYDGLAFTIISSRQVSFAGLTYQNSMVKFILSKKWQNNDLKFNGNERLSANWDPPEASAVFSLRSRSEYFWNGG